MPATALPLAVPAPAEGRPEATLARVERLVVATLSLWFVAVLVLGWAGIFGGLPSAAPGVIAVLQMTGIVALYRLNAPFRAFVRSVPFKHLTIFNIWRLPAGALFLHYGAQGLLPPLFVQNAAWGDIIAALLVPVVLMLPEWRAKWAAFQVVGFADFIIAVGTGVMLNVLDTPGMGNIAELPLVLIPLFGVPITGAVHVIMLDRLFRRRDAAHA